MYKKIYGSTADGYCTSLLLSNTAATLLIGAPSSDSMDSDAGEWHSFLFFDTSFIPNGAKVIKAKLTYRIVSLQGDPDAFDIRAYVGDNTIGSSLEKEDYGDVIADGQLFGTTDTIDAGAKSLTTTNDTILAEISKKNYTNFEFDAYWQGGAGTSGVIASIASQENATTSYRPTLEVWYRLPKIQIY